MSSPSEEREQRHATKERDKITIELYRKHLPCLHADSKDLCIALRKENPRLQNVFAQIDNAVKDGDEKV